MYDEKTPGKGLYGGPLRTTARKDSQLSMSSLSSGGHSDSSDDNPTDRFERQSSLRDFGHRLASIVKESDFRCRSNSDGALTKKENDDPLFQVFPSLPNTVLEKMGLHGNGPRDRLSEEETEQKFTSLALAFSIDSATIKDRCERQKRNRDQTETNLSKEIEKLKEKLTLIQPLCNDFESAETLSTIMTQVEIITRASSLVSTAAEKYGAVQHEERLAESVQLMVNHVQMLKQQRDSARRQLQYTKRVLQNSGTSTACISPTTPQKSIIPPSKGTMCRRRASIAIASIATILDKSNGDKKITRRISDLSLRASSLNKATRPSRLEMGVDLTKIKENFGDEGVEDCQQHDEEESAPEENFEEMEDQKEQNNNSDDSLDVLDSSMGAKIKRKFKKMKRRYNRWVQDGTFHEVYCFCALICFSISLLSMVSILVEYEFTKRGLSNSNIFWSWPGDKIRRKIKP